MGRLDGKVAVVTGGAQGIGRGIARRFAREGARVLVADVRDDLGQAVADDLADLGGEGLYLHTDVTSREEVERMVVTTHDHFGALNVLVNDAIALAPHIPLEQKTDEMFAFMDRVGVSAARWAMQAAFPIMRQQGGGQIVNFYSSDAENGQWYHSDYNVTKAGIRALSISAAAEWARYGIRCNVIAPAAAGSIYYQLVEKNPALLEMVKQTPFGRAGDPETDIAPVALFLATEDSQFITGQTLYVDGGITLSTGSVYPPDDEQFTRDWLDSHQ